MIHVSCKRMFFNCRCPPDFGSILFLVVVSVRLSQLRRNSNCWICNYLSWERERRHIEWGWEVNTQGLTPPRLLKRSTKPFFYLRWNNSSARTAITAEAHHSFQMTFSIIVRVKTTLPSSRQIYYCKHNIVWSRSPLVAHQVHYSQNVSATLQKNAHPMSNVFK